MSMIKQYILALCILLLSIKGMHSESSNNQTIMNYYQKLRENLEANYDVNARPVKYNSNLTEVDIMMKFTYILDLDEEQQKIEIDGTVLLSWEDSHLSWNPDNYYKIRKIYFPPNKIWKPDIYEIQTGGPSGSLTQNNLTHITLYFNGGVRWYIPSSLIGKCDFDYINYPSDIIKCRIKLESWSYRGDTIDLLDPSSPYVKKFRNNNPHWNFKASYAKKIIVKIGPNNYPIIEVTLFLTRRLPTVQYQLQWITSVIVVLLTLSMFWLPADIRQKLTLGCIILIMLTITLVCVISVIRVSKISELIAKPIHITMFIVITAIIFEIIIINFRYIQDYEPPEFIINIFSGTVAKLLLINSVYQETQPIDKIKLFDTQDEIAPLQQLTKNENWQIIGQISDRVLFITYIILLSAIPKTT